MAIAPSRSVSLQSYSGMATPAFASHLTTVRSTGELVDALRFADEQQLNPLVLGEGSNTVFRSDYDGLVILNQIAGLEVLEENTDSVLLRANAGESWHRLVQQTVGEGWYGLENLALIPGSVGAAPIQNIGAYGAELADFVAEVEFLRTDTQKIESLAVGECRFGYRDSIFKGVLKNKAVITSVTLRLNKHAGINLSYGALRDHIGDRDCSPLDVFDAVCEIRGSKLPLPEQIPNCGSFFKNPVISNAAFEEIQQRHPKIKYFEAKDSIKLAAAWMIEDAGWKGKSYRGVAVHQQQALVIVNPEHRSGELVCEFAEQIRADIKSRFGVTLEIEPLIV